MTVTGTMVMTRGGAVLALDQRIADALLNYAVEAARAEDVPAQTWVRTRWGLKEYEAKHILKGNASKAHYEWILKRRGPHCGWPVALAVTGAVIGQDVADHFKSEREAVANERARHEAEEARIATLEAHARERAAFARLGAGQGPLQGRRSDGEPRVAPARVGGRPPR